MELSMRWAERSRKAMTLKSSLFFGIVQGGMHLDLRAESIEKLRTLDCDGIAIGGLSVGEPIPLMHEMTQKLGPLLPKELPHYLMGVGTPLDLLNGINSGIDMFDCVMPTRMARNGGLFTSEGLINIKKAQFTDDEGPLDPQCSCSTCLKYSRGYLRHLFINNEILASRLHTYHNLHFYHSLMARGRIALEEGLWPEFFREESQKIQKHQSI
jgi:queuine tRNA-ribosyltransferase